MKPGSLRQVVLGAYCLSLIPLLVVLWQSFQNLDAVIKQGAVQARFATAVSQSMAEVEANGFDVIRVFRQRKVVSDINLDELGLRYVQSLDTSLGELCGQLGPIKACPNMLETAEGLSSAIEARQSNTDSLLSRLTAQTNELQAAIQAYLAARFAESEKAQQRIQMQQLYVAAGMIFISVVFIWLGAKGIIRPITRLQSLIHAIASQQVELPKGQIDGPRELQMLDGDLRVMADRLANLESMRAVMLRHAAHELKTPLSSIKEGCSLLAEDVVGTLNPGQREVVELLDKSIERLSTLIEQLLDYNRLLQHSTADMKVLNPKEILNACLAENGLAIQQQNAVIDVKMDTDTVWADAVLLRRILDNLLSNALAYGDLREPISISLESNENRHVLRVMNAGQVIDESSRAELFEAFKRGNQPRNDNVTGAGLGLTIVFDCARMMGGRAYISDHQSADVCFEVTWPTHQGIQS